MCSCQTSALDDTRGGLEANAAKGIALDHLGDVAAKLRTFQQEAEADPLPTLDEVSLSFATSAYRRSFQKRISRAWGDSFKPRRLFMLT